MNRPEQLRVMPRRARAPRHERIVQASGEAVLLDPTAGSATVLDATTYRVLLACDGTRRRRRRPCTPV